MMTEKKPFWLCLIFSLFICCYAASVCSGLEVNTTYSVELTRTSSSSDSSSLLVLTNGTVISSKNLNVTFSITPKAGDTCEAYIALKGESFSSNSTVQGVIINGQLIIDGVSSIFLVSPDALVEDQEIVLTETEKWSLIGNVTSRTSKPQTVINDLFLNAITVEAFHVADSTVSMPSVLSFASDSGILVVSAFSLSDILLNELGVDYIQGGVFRLSSYSENLNIHLFPYVNWFPIYLILIAAAIFGVLVAFMYRSKAKKKRIRKNSLKTKFMERLVFEQK
ncbi:MAG: hypothetical protein NWF04_05135 [Candidatus Bathyarchaeota archaeon]|nr:hypothetical protein [Candidatus Bathyarchaeota archaeon]